MWHDPPADVLEAWREAAHDAFGARPRAACPTGDGGVLRYFFFRHDSAPAARGGFWIWCPICGSYEHGSTRVPEWWRDVIVPDDQLMHDPGWLNDNWDDDWLKRQPVHE